jgi:hypothetical protein
MNINGQRRGQANHDETQETGEREEKGEKERERERYHDSVEKRRTSVNNGRQHEHKESMGAAAVHPSHTHRHDNDAAHSCMHQFIEYNQTISQLCFTLTSARLFSSHACMLLAFYSALTLPSTLG